MDAIKWKQLGRLSLGGCLGVALQVQAAGLPALQEEIHWLQEEHYVTTATKTLESLKKSGSTMTLITAKDLEQMGARNLMDALKRVPGFGINRFNMGTSSVEVRGVKTDFSEKVLFLVNGHPTNNNLVNGGALSSYNNFPVKDINVVEIVRGPGSALYGANAFVAVINIVTKRAEDLNGSELSAAVGSFETSQLNLQHGSRIGELDFAFNINAFNTDGWRGEVDSDSLGQSGKTDYWQQRYELGFQSSFKQFELQGRYVQRKAGGYLGANYVLNQGSEQDYTEYFVEGAYHYSFNADATLTAKLYFDHFEFDNLWDVYPEGFTDSNLITYPDGLFLRSPIRHDKTGTDIQLTWRWTPQHKLVTGAAFEHQAQYGVEFWSNGVDISDVANWNDSHNRNIRALYVQDIWDPSESVRVIIGGRYDDYSDFGDTFNPRASVSWELTDRYQVIATYGSAFRAPTFGELYNINNPSIVGNPEVDPEEIETAEIGLQAELAKRSQARVTLFFNTIDDIIAPRPQSGSASYSDNIGELEVLGVEMEYHTRFDQGSSLGLNYTYQDATNKLLHARTPDVPLHRININYTYRYSRALSVFAGVLYESGLERDVGDTRSGVSDQATLDLALTWRNHSESVLVTASLYNALDEDLVDPSPAVMLSDYPNAGRSFMLDLELKL